MGFASSSPRSVNIVGSVNSTSSQATTVLVELDSAALIKSGQRSDAAGTPELFQLSENKVAFADGLCTHLASRNSITGL